MRRIGLAVLALVVLGYAGVCGYLWSQQTRLLYPGATTDITPLTAPTLPGFALVHFTADDGNPLGGWWHPPAPALGHAPGVVLYLHGNRAPVADEGRQHRYADIAATGLGVLAIEYRGYGGQGGTPSEAGLQSDAAGALTWIARTAPGARVALFGESLGTGVAVATAAHHPVAGVMLDSPYTSIASVGQHQYPLLPVGPLLRDHWDSLSRITSIHAPLLVVHCSADRLIPLHEGQSLYAAALPPKAMITLPACAHIQIWRPAAKGAVLAHLLAWVG